ncbi:MAG: DUF1705 domain-containing protein [Sulfurisoma sp.]|nr:DUF1705 domain-containing protein [Sulfurisoma sp.]
MRPQFLAHGLSSNALILWVSAFLLAGGNLSFFAHVLKDYPLTTGNAPALFSLLWVFGAATALLLALVCFRYTTKPVLIGILLLSALAACFMDSYGIVINSEMLQNAAQTNLAEAGDLLTFKLLSYFVVLGVLPAIGIANIPLRWRGWRGWRAEAAARAKLLGALALALVGTVLVFGSFYASFARENSSAVGSVAVGSD